MISHFVEATNGFNHGKFVLLRHDESPRSALPGYEELPLLSGRKWTSRETFVVDLQTGEGAAFTLAGSGMNARFDLDKHKIWVCPLFEPFLGWLYEQELDGGAGDITALPRFVDLVDAPGAVFGFRRPGE